MPGILASSALAPATRQPVACLSSRLPAVWSAWWWVERIQSSFQPLAASRSSTGAATGGSTTAVTPALGSCTR